MTLSGLGRPPQTYTVEVEIELEALALRPVVSTLKSNLVCNCFGRRLSYW
jgi:hypothetical protein